MMMKIQTPTNKNFNPEDLISASTVLKNFETWKIFTHKKADGDALGSSTALYTVGKNLGKKVTWINPDEILPETYKYLSGYDAHETYENFNFEDLDGVLYIFLDCSNHERGTLGLEPEKNLNVLNIDHHEDNTNFGRVNCVDSRASSTCEMLYRLFKAGKFEITHEIAESLYTGILTDTGGFSFSNTSPLTHEIAANLIEHGIEPSKLSDLINQNKTPADFLLWSRAMSRVKIFGPENAPNIFAISILKKSDFQETGADMTGTEGLSSMFMTIRGIKFISTITEYPNGDIRLSIRSREGSPFGAGEFARPLGGGGHERAAGAKLECPIDDAMEVLEKLIMQKYHECVNSD
ncbi:MAG: bifunctional oligoribonuclease/PAP phosphatase NrnA [Synergistaceae bacterium]|nr:bifunctional oligoribonuclease/PAP phosphatase NrnA [Synergistaceae bacterium]